MSLLTDILARQHRRVLELLDQAEETPESRVLRALADEVVGHTIVEEELVYPLRRRPLECQAQALEEHAILRFALERLLAADPGHCSFDARVRSLREMIVHHCDREERARLPRMEKEIGIRRSRRLARDVAARFDELVELGHRSALRGRRRDVAR